MAETAMTVYSLTSKITMLKSTSYACVSLDVDNKGACKSMEGTAS